MTSAWAIAGVLVASLLASIGALCLKLSTNKISLKPSELIRNYYLIIGALLYLLSAGLLVLSLRYGELSVLYPIMAASYIWISILSVKILNEKMTPSKWIGITLIVLGITMIGWGS